LPALFAPGSGGVARLALEATTAAATDSSTSSSLLLGGLLVVVCADGDVCVWDLSRLVKVGQASLAPLLAPSRALAASLAASAASAGPGAAAVGNFGAGAASTAAAGADAGAATAGLRLSRLEAVLVGRGSDGRPRVAVTILSAPVSAAAAAGNGSNTSGSSGGASRSSSSSSSSSPAAGLTALTSLEAFGLHCGLGAWVRLADGRFAASDYLSAAPPPLGDAGASSSPSSPPPGALSVADAWLAPALHEQPLAQLHWAVADHAQALASLPGSGAAAALTAAALFTLEPPAGAAASAAAGAAAGSAGQQQQQQQQAAAGQLATLARAGPWQRLATQAHLEERVACAAALGAASEFAHWLGVSCAESF
jgi:hypothetical protein